VATADTRPAHVCYPVCLSTVHRGVWPQPIPAQLTSVTLSVCLYVLRTPLIVSQQCSNKFFSRIQFIKEVAEKACSGNGWHVSGCRPEKSGHSTQPSIFIPPTTSAITHSYTPGNYATAADILVFDTSIGARHSAQDCYLLLTPSRMKSLACP